MIGTKGLLGLGVLAVCLAFREAPRLERQEPFVCPPCGADCHDGTYAKAGNCSGCGMELVARSAVPQVAILLFPGTDVLSFSGPAGVFASSHGMNVYTVADTDDPIRCQGFLEVVPQYSFDDAPPADILIVPPAGPTELDDEYIMGWLAKAAEEADHVLTVGAGTIAAAKTGLLDGEEVAAGGFLLRRAAQYAPEVTFSSEVPVLEAGKFVTARDNAAAIDAAFTVLALVAGEDKAMTTARQLGFTWSPELK